MTQQQKRDFYRRFLKELYRSHAPDKEIDLDALLDKYTLKELALFTKLFNIYKIKDEDLFKLFVCAGGNSNGAKQFCRQTVASMYQQFFSGSEKMWSRLDVT